MAKFLKSWSDRFIGNVHLQLALANEIVARLEAARDRRTLAPHEESLCKDLKLKALGLSSLQCMIACQESRVTLIHEGNASTHFFHAHANSHWRRNFIMSLEHGGQVPMSEDDKAEVTLEFFEGILA
jgi:hypothetical protein